MNSSKVSAPVLRRRGGRPSLTPGTYFRLLLIGYFEGIDSERGRTRHHKPHPWPPKAISITDQNGRHLITDPKLTKGRMSYQQTWLLTSHMSGASRPNVRTLAWRGDAAAYLSGAHGQVWHDDDNRASQ